jgi:ligand-binding sensor domain-containing protein
VVGLRRLLKSWRAWLFYTSSVKRAKEVTTKFDKTLCVLSSLLCFIITDLTLSAQLSFAASTWNYISPHNLGLPSNTITALHQDQSGTFWVATRDGGLAEFTDTRWTIHSQTQEFWTITSIASDSQGTLWAIGEGGRLWRYFQDKWNHWEGGTVGAISDKRAKPVAGEPCILYPGYDFFSVSPEVYEGVPYINEAYISEIKVDQQDHLWILYIEPVPKLILRFDGEKIECWEDGEGLPDQFSQSGWTLEITPEGNIWISMRNQMSEYKNDQWSPLPAAPKARHLTTGINGVIWAGAPYEVFKHIDNNWEKKLEWDSSEGWIRAVAADSLGGVWVVYGNTSPNLVHLKEGKRIEYSYPVEIQLANQTIICLLVDQDNQLWLGDPEGLYMLDENATSVLQKTWGEIKTDIQP